VRRAARLAKRIITGSNFSKSEIVNFLRVPEEKVSVIYYGAGEEFQAPQSSELVRERLDRYGIRQPYVLNVGNICRRKNQLAAVRGFGRWLADNRECEHALVLVGKQLPYAQEVLAEASRLGLDSSRLILLGFVRDEDLPYLYAGAALLLNTSLYEGFGLPLAEAMRCGVPIVASHASCFPEIAGDAARYVNPNDADDVAAAITDVIENANVREGLILRGRHRTQLFQWDKMARETLKLYYAAGAERNR
jgi:glycosyltransferase involved in cell wall biosynthesis